MAEHTLTTETIRERFADAYGNYANGLEDFDRWLAAHDAEVRADHESEAAERLGLLLWHLTGGRLSKSTYDVSTMVAQIEDTFERERAAEQADVVRAGVVAEEPDWEYGYELIESDTRDVLTRGFPFDTAAQAAVDALRRADEEFDPEYPPLSPEVVRRRKAGPWVPVNQEGASHA
ncbi:MULTISPECIES: hypothetical protein [unclassified Microbacterium]|uniref:hypothetical protein n=1 Tax=unclassified Microbacterium TaxID=2609290 RepID=UPI000EA9855D|nr:MULTISPECIES: hypothetical protein [unclassified Microbacterium]MBT2484821.1 hypothetical protein [Microbacterium sp. ISL-108]RKN67692.1 hypothetical protein D7252_08895 [Microbacterium sp. CGR2]